MRLTESSIGNATVWRAELRKRPENVSRGAYATPLASDFRFAGFSKGVVSARDRVLFFSPTLAFHTLSGTSNGFRYVRPKSRFASGSLMHVSVFSSKRMARPVRKAILPRWH